MSSFKKIALAVAASLPGIAANAHNLATCRVLVENQNDLWLVQGNGSLISRITNDARLKPAAAIQPGGKLIAYSTQDQSRDVVLTDTEGRVLDQVSANAGEPVVELKWTAPGSLRAAIHQSPSHSQFRFFNLQPGNRLARLPVGLVSGADCAVSPAGRQLACTTGDAVTLDGKDLYFASGPFESSTVVQTSTIGLGGSLSTNTTPILRVDFLAQAANSVSLRVTTPDKQSQEERVPTGGVMAVTVSDGAGLIGLEPVRTSDPHAVKLLVRTSHTGRAIFDGKLAWDPDGNRIAVVESNDAGRLTLVLLARQMGQAAVSGQGAVDAKIVLPIQGPVSAIRFMTSTTIRVEGKSEAVEYTIPARGKVRSPTYSIKPLQVPPTSLLVTPGGDPVVTRVRDWACP